MGSKEFVTDDDSVSLLEQINELCEAFEKAWQPESSLEDLAGLLIGWQDKRRKSLFVHLLRLELELRQQSDTVLGQKTYELQFPEFSDIIEHQFRYSGSASATTDDTLGDSTTFRSPGRCLGRYHVLHELGRGSFGTVYQAYDPQLARYVAVKVWHAKVTEAHATAFLGEAKRTATLRHESIVKVFDVGQTTDGTRFLVMEFIDGRSLKSWVKSVAPSRSEITHLMAQISDAVGHAHRRGIIHRDLKPSNILVDTTGRPLVVDFGLAIHESECANQGAELAGSFPYMSPEQVQGEANAICPATDVWALGVILFELLTGSRPFGGQTANELTEAIVRTPTPPLSPAQASPQLRRIVTTCLDKSAERRYRHAGELSRALKAYDRRKMRSGVLVGVTSVVLIVLLASLTRWTNRASPEDRSNSQQLVKSLVQQLRTCELTELHKLELTIHPLWQHIEPRVRMSLDEATDSDTEIRLRAALLPHDAAQIKPIIDWLLSTDAKQAGAVYAALIRPLPSERRDRAVDILRSKLWQASPEISGTQLAWQFPARALLGQVEAAQGLLTAEFGFCQTLDAGALDELTQALRPANYRPIRMSLYRDGDLTRAAVIWTRDNLHWRLHMDCTLEELRVLDRQARADGLVPTDVTVYRHPSEPSGVLYGGVWQQRVEATDAKLLITTEGTYGMSAAGLRLEGYRETAFDRRETAGGLHVTCSVWRKAPNSASDLAVDDELHADYAADLPGLQHAAVLEATGWISREVRYKRQLDLANRFLVQRPHEENARFLRARARYYLRDTNAAERELTEIVSTSPSLRRYAGPLLAQTLAQLGRSEESTQVFGDYQELMVGQASRRNWFEAYVPSLEAKLRIYRGDVDAALRELESHLATRKNSTEALFYAASVYSVAAEQATESAVQQATFGRRAEELLRRAKQRGLSSDLRMLEAADLEWLRAHSPSIGEVLPPSFPTYHLNWLPSQITTSQAEIGKSPGTQLSLARRYMQKGFRPVSISALRIDESPTPSVALVWRQRAIGEVAGQARRAHAALMLLDLEADDRLWRLVRRSPDSTLRSLMILRACHFLSATRLIDQLEAEHDADIRNAIISALCEYDWTQTETSERLRAFSIGSQLQRQEIDPGVRNAGDLLLRRLPTSDTEVDVPSAVDLADASSSGRSYWTSQKQTMIVVNPTHEFAIGSPKHDEYRTEDEAQVLVPSLRSFSLSATETTLGQYQEFAPDFVSPTGDANANQPVIGVSWFNAASYCNWLSRREGIPESQWCYVADPESNTGHLRAAKSWQQRLGYRLPSESEWEYCCRAGAETQWSFGDSPDVLDHYAWTFENSNLLSHSVGTRLPNRLGFFDMHGNAGEWCQDRWDTRVRPANSVESEVDVRRVIKGGSYTLAWPHSRSASRVGRSPQSKQRHGFRIAKTLVAPLGK